MGDDDKRSKAPLVDRVKERFRDLVDDLTDDLAGALDALEGLMRPPPAPVPVRSRRWR